VAVIRIRSVMQFTSRVPYEIRLPQPRQRA
jgi:hypothetical protein